MSWWDGISNGVECAGGLGANAQACGDAAGAVVDKAGDAATSAAVEASSGMFDKIAAAIGQAAGDLLTSSMTWWLTTDSVNVEPAKALSGEHPIKVLITFILMAGVLCTAIMMALFRRGQPLIDMLTGAAKYMIIQSLSLLVLSQALTFGDAAAKMLVANGAENFGPEVSKLLGLQAISNPAMLAFIALVCWVLSFIQWVMGFLRQGGIVVLAAMISIAAAGQLFPWGRQWFPRIAAMLVALVLYKPMAAMIYQLGFKLIGDGGKDQALHTVLIGVAVLAIAVIALPGMIGFFAWVGTPAASQVSSGAAAAEGAAAVVGGADLASSMSSWGDKAEGGNANNGSDPMASFMENNGPGTGTPDSVPGPGAHNMADPQPWETPGGTPEPASGAGENPDAFEKSGGDGLGAPSDGAGAGLDAESVGSTAASGAAAGAATGGAALAADKVGDAATDTARRTGELAEGAASTMTGSELDNT